MLVWPRALAVAVACAALLAAEACMLERFKPQAFPAAGNFTVEVVGDLPRSDGADVSYVLFAGDSPASETPASSTGAVDDGVMIYVADALVAGATYGVRVYNSTTSTVLCETRTRWGFAHAGITIQDVGAENGLADASTLYSVEGKRRLTITGNNLFFPENDDDVRVRYRNPDGTSAGLDTQPGSVTIKNGQIVVATTTPAVPRPVDWLLSCADQLNPVKSQDCVPDIPMNISVSMDGGISYSNELPITFGYVRPLRAAFIYIGPVDDFGWTHQLNEGRIQLESTFGASLNTSTYFESVDEGEFENDQANKGKTIRTQTPVPSHFVNQDGVSVVNKYYKGFAIMKKLCDEDYDLVVSGSFGLMSQTEDVSADYPGCHRVGDGGDAGAASYSTRFVNIGGFKTTPSMSTAFAKIYQMRYLAGIVAGYELGRRKALDIIENTYDASNPPCIGYIAAFPLPEVQRGINALLLGCKEEFPECKVKVLWSGVWHNSKLEEAAAAFFWHEAGCKIITQHSDTAAPQHYYKERGGASLGYNSDSRSLVGDSVLTSASMRWAPAFEHFVHALRDDQWSSEQIWFGVDQGAVELAPYFSPRVPADVQDRVLRRKRELEAANGDDALRQIFCGDLQKRWVYARDEGRVKYGCGSQPEWVRLEETESINAEHFRDANGNPLSPGQAIKSTDCLWGVNFPGEALLSTGDSGFSDYLLDGVELFEPQVTPYGTIHNASSHGCVSDAGATGDRFFLAPNDLPECNGKQWEYSRGQCDTSTMSSEVTYTWVVNETTKSNLTCGNELGPNGKFSTPAALPYVPFGEDAPPCDYVPMRSRVANVVVVLSVVGVVFHVAVIILITIHRRHKAMMASQPKLVLYMCLGGVLLNLSTLAFLGAPTDALCAVRVWSFNISFQIVFSFLLSKIYRVWKLFESNAAKKLKRVVVRDADMVRVSAFLIFIDVLILLAWQVDDPSTPMSRVIFVKLPAEGLGSITYTECASKGNIYSIATLMFKVFLILAACVLVFGSKNIPSSYVEHKFIVFSAYNTAIFSGVVLLLTGAESNDPSTGLMIHAAGVTAGSILVNGSIALPRILLAFDKWSISTSSTEASRPEAMGPSATVTGMTTSHGSEFEFKN